MDTELKLKFMRDETSIFKSIALLCWRTMWHVIEQWLNYCEPFYDNSGALHDEGDCSRKNCVSLTFKATSVCKLFQNLRAYTLSAGLVEDLSAGLVEDLSAGLVEDFYAGILAECYHIFTE